MRADILSLQPCSVTLASSAATDAISAYHQTNASISKLSPEKSGELDGITYTHGMWSWVASMHAAEIETSGSRVAVVGFYCFDG